MLRKSGLKRAFGAIEWRNAGPVLLIIGAMIGLFLMLNLGGCATTNPDGTPRVITPTRVQLTTQIAASAYFSAKPLSAAKKSSYSTAIGIGLMSLDRNDNPPPEEVVGRVYKSVADPMFQDLILLSLDVLNEEMGPVQFEAAKKSKPYAQALLRGLSVAIDRQSVRP